MLVYWRRQASLCKLPLTACSYPIQVAEPTDILARAVKRKTAPRFGWFLACFGLSHHLIWVLRPTESCSTGKSKTQKFHGCCLRPVMRAKAYWNKLNATRICLKWEKPSNIESENLKIFPESEKRVNVITSILIMGGMKWREWHPENFWTIMQSSNCNYRRMRVEGMDLKVVIPKKKLRNSHALQIIYHLHDKNQ